MNSDASRSHVLSFNTKLLLRITKVKMCCGPHAVSGARSVCRTSHEILTFFFLRSEDPQGIRTPFYVPQSLFFEIRKSLVAAVPLKVLTKSCCGGGAVNIFFLICSTFTKCTCSFCAVKNFMLTKKHRNCECA